MQGRGRVESRQQGFRSSRSLKALAQLSVPVMALSQLSRAVEMRQNKRPRWRIYVSRITGNKTLLVCFCTEDYYDPETEKRITELIIAKHRNGPIGTIDLLFQKEFSKFVGLEKFRKPS